MVRQPTAIQSYQIGTVEGMVGDEVPVRFGEVVIQVPAEILEKVESNFT